MKKFSAFAQKVQFCIASVMFVASCTDGENFQGGNETKAPAQKAFETVCNPAQNISGGSTVITSYAVPPVKISGTFCQAQIVTAKKKTIQVVMVNDISGSMATNDPGCKRYSTIEAVLQKLKPTSTNPKAILPDYQVALVNFDTVAEDVKIGGSTFLPINQFISSMASRRADICAARTGTNYEAAFSTAHSLLQPSGQTAVDSRMVFFISDGEPSAMNPGASSSDTPESAGIRAATKLRSLPFLELFIGYLNTETSGTPPGLKKLTLEKNIAVASNAAQLAAAVEAIVPVEPINLESQTSQLATLSAPGFASRSDIQTRIFEVSPGSGIWSFETPSEFPLFGLKGQTTLNTFTVVAQSANGQSVRAVYQISFEYK